MIPTPEPTAPQCELVTTTRADLDAARERARPIPATVDALEADYRAALTAAGLRLPAADWRTWAAPTNPATRVQSRKHAPLIPADSLPATDRSTTTQ